MTPFSSVTDSYILTQLSSSIIGYSSKSIYKFRQCKNLSNPVFILLSMVRVSFFSLKIVTEFCKENSKNFAENL